ncbi:glycosyltransferase family 4 protein [Cohnella sp. JJ-181]|uniref:glycosyltransferase family 4 protein n=1 Tax=Cohnella rhizoplanae TaxID=2974897 RepID=UPI00232B4286|nr:glycosyltransferase family 4 protein [Cohnella sp. JJ-181]
MLRDSRAKRLGKGGKKAGAGRKARGKAIRAAIKRKVGKRSVDRAKPIYPESDAHSYIPQPNLRQASGERLSILYLVHSFFPESFTGTEKFVLNMARSMQDKGHRVKVVTYSPSLAEDGANAVGDVFYGEYAYEGVPVLAYRHRTFDPESRFEFGDPSLLAFADHVLEREQPSIVHIGHPMRALEFARSSQLRGIPYVITLTDYWTICPKSVMLYDNLQPCSGPEGGAACLARCRIPNVQDRLASLLPILESASLVLSPSAFLASMVKSVFPALRVEVLPHGLRYASLLLNKKVYGKGSPLTFVYGGSITEHKGVHVIIQAMSLVRSPRLRLNLYGTGHPDYMRAMQEMASADPRIAFQGSYSEADLPRIYQESDVAVVPSVWYENYPFALIEALASGVPAVVSDIGGMAEKVRDGTNGLTFRAGNAGDLARQFKRILQSPALLNSLKRNLRRSPRRSVEDEAYAYENVYFTHAR